MKDVEYAMRFVCQRNREGSYATIANREASLRLIGRQLEELGFRHIKKAEQLKPKHIWKLVERWKEEGKTDGAIKNRMSHLRWIAAKTGNRGLVANDNDHYGIGRRQYITNESKALNFESAKIDQIQNKYARLSAELQKEFGLRREEAMKFIPSKADQGDRIILKGSWCKGGKEREIPVRSQAQRDVLDRARAFVLEGSMIPPKRTYVQHMEAYKKAMGQVGLGRTHGARHMYAQQRYEEMTGRLPPALGGKSRHDMTRDERARDDQVRLAISREMGHERMQIVAVYIGT